MPFQFKEAKRELRKSLPLSAIIRLVFSVVIIIALTAHFLPKYIPDLEFDWTSALIKCLCFLGLILAMCVVISILPPQVQVTPNGIAVSQGQSHAFFPYAELSELRIDEDTSPPVLILRRRDQPASRTFAVSAKVDLPALHATLDKHKPKR